MATRRRLLRGGVAAIATRAFPLAGSVAVLLPSRPAQAAWWIAAAQVVGAVAGLMSTFGARGDGGLGAMFTAIQEKLDLIVEQNNQMRLQIATVQASVDKLPDVIRVILRTEWIKQTNSKIDGLIIRFEEMRIAMNDYDDGYQNPAIQNMLEELLNNASEIRSQTMSHEYGRGYEVMISLGQLANVELCSHALKLDLGDNLYKRRLGAYVEWIDLALRDGVSLNVADQLEEFTRKHDNARNKLFAAIKQAGAEGGPADGVGAARCLRLREYRRDVTHHRERVACDYAAPIDRSVDLERSVPLSAKSIAGLQNKRLAARLNNVVGISPQGGAVSACGAGLGCCYSEWDEVTHVWGAQVEGERSNLIEEYDHPTLHVAMLALTLHVRKGQAEQCELISVANSPIVSTDAGCAVNGEWRRAELDGAALGAPIELLFARISGGLPAPYPARDCDAVAPIAFGTDEAGRSALFDNDERFLQMASLARSIIPLVDDTNGYRLFQLVAMTTAAGLTELRAQFIERIAAP